MKVETKREDGYSPGYETAKVEVSVDETAYPDIPQLIWTNADGYERKTVVVRNTGTADVTVQLKKRFGGVVEETLASGPYEGNVPSSATGGTFKGSAITANAPTGEENEDRYFYDTTLKKWFEHEAEEEPDPEMITLVEEGGIILSQSTMNIKEGETKTYTVKLSVAPTASMTVDVAGGSGSNIALAPIALTFTPSNWETPQVVTVEGTVDTDDQADETITFTHTRSDGLVPTGNPDTYTTVTEAGIVISKDAFNLVEGQDDTYQVKLASQPSAAMTVSITGASGDVSVDNATLNFSTSNWDTFQTVTVTAASDADTIDETPVTLSHARSDRSTVAPGTAEEITVGGITLSRARVNVAEAGTATYTVELDAEPADDVTVDISGHSGTDISLSSASLDFTPDNWDTAQTVTITASADTDALNDEITLVHSRSDGVGITDSATATETTGGGITLNRGELTVVEGNTATYTVELEEDPEQDVQVSVRVPVNAKISVDHETLDFTTDNWDTAQTVTVTAAQDSDEEQEEFTILHSLNPGFGEVGLDVTVIEDDPKAELVATIVDDEARADVVVTVLDKDRTADIAITLIDSTDYTEIDTGEVDGAIGGTWIGDFDDAVAASKYFISNTYSETATYIFYDREEGRVSIAAVNGRTLPETGLILETDEDNTEIVIPQNQSRLYDSILPSRYLDFFFKVATGTHTVEITISGRS